MSTVRVRYIVHDVDAAMSFYRRHLGFEMVMHPAPSFAMLSRGDLRLVLSAPNPSADSHRTLPQPSNHALDIWLRHVPFHNDERKA